MLTVKSSSVESQCFGLLLTSTDHYGHTNIIKYQNRPFDSVKEMNGRLIANHNAVVGSEDITIHAGDFSFRSTEETQKIIKRLSGQHIFIKGSHDKWNKELPYMWEKTIDGIHVVVCHYSLRTWPRSHYGSISLYGHSHGHLPPEGLQMDVGVDCNNFYPFSFKQIKKCLKLEEVKKN